MRTTAAVCRGAGISLTAITMCHAPVLAAIHAEAFEPGERWDNQAFAGLLDMPGTFGWLDARGGFVLARNAGGDGEILTLAVVPGARRQGIARALVTAASNADGPTFLEVAAGNDVAVRLYLSLGFFECGQRRGYYGQGRDALVLRLDPATVTVAP